MRRFALLAFCLSSFLHAADADLQVIADALSVEHYTATQKSIESMGLGIYGGPIYDQKTRGRKFDGILGDFGNQEARKYLMETFAGFGLTGSVQGKYLNFIAEQTGTVTPDNILVLCAHYDTNSSNSPGGDGDASGVAAVVECARVLSQYSFDNTIRYIVFNASARGFKGSNDYVRNVFGVGKEKLVGVVDVNQILHPYHDKNPALPSALTVSLGARPRGRVGVGIKFCVGRAAVRSGAADQCKRTVQQYQQRPLFVRDLRLLYRLAARRKRARRNRQRLAEHQRRRQRSCRRRQL